MSNFRKVFLALVTAVCVALAGCGSGGSKADKTPTTQAGIPGQDPQAVQDVQVAFRNLAAVKSLRADLAAEVMQANGNVTTSRFTYEFVPPEKYQLISTTNSITRVVGSETFSRTADGVWSKDPFSGPQYEGYNHLFESKFLLEAAKQIGVTAKVVKAGLDKAGDTQCQMYTLTDLPTQNSTDICIANAYPVRMVFHAGALSTTALLRDFNAPIEIDRPAVQ